MQKNILILHHSKGITEMMSHVLSASILDCGIWFAKSVEDALSIIRQETISLIFLDVSMPDFGSIRLIERMTLQKLSIPYIAMCGDENGEEQEDVDRLGVILCMGQTKYLKSPFEESTVVAAAQSMINQPQQDAPTDHR